MRRSISRPLSVALSEACLCAVCCTLAFAQDRPEAGTVKDGVGPQLRLSVSKADFRCGEVIPLDLTFTSGTSDRY